jgi:hypothetical protein
MSLISWHCSSSPRTARDLAQRSVLTNDVAVSLHALGSSAPQLKSFGGTSPNDCLRDKPHPYVQLLMLAFAASEGFLILSLSVLSPHSSIKLVSVTDPELRSSSQLETIRNSFSNGATPPSLQDGAQRRSRPPKETPNWCPDQWR